MLVGERLWNRAHLEMNDQGIPAQRVGRGLSGGRTSHVRTLTLCNPQLYT